MKQLISIKCQDRRSPRGALNLQSLLTRNRALDCQVRHPHQKISRQADGGLFHIYTKCFSHIYFNIFLLYLKKFSKPSYIFKSIISHIYTPRQYFPSRSNNSETLDYIWLVNQ
jgi:hypothetical protein